MKIVGKPKKHHEVIDELEFDEDGLIGVIVQDESTYEVLMFAWMNSESLFKTLESKETWFYSRSRGGLWHKGETSGNFQKVRRVLYDCDSDCLLVLVDAAGPACHTGQKSCFHREIDLTI